MAESDSAEGKIFMCQQNDKRHQMIAVHIVNNSPEIAVLASTSVEYHNCVQIGDCPLLEDGSLVA